MKKLFSLLAALLLAAAGYAQSGTTGDLTWELTTDGTFTISGSGAMPDYVSNTQPWGFYHASIKSVVVADGVTSIGDYAFSYCGNLTSVVIPSSVTSIDDRAFSYCSRLSSVTVAWTTPIAINSDVFLAVNTSRVRLIVPQGTEAAYAAVWKYFYIEGLSHLNGGTTGDLTWELNLTDGTLTI